ncbi:MAG: PDZ domain-containing protein, partial [Piscinibacter sp.]
QRAELNLRDWTAPFGGDDSAPCPEALAPVALTRHRSLPVITLATGERYVLDSGNPAGLIRIEAEPPEPATQGLILAGELRLTVLPEAVLGPQRRSDVPVLRLTQPALHRALGDAARGLAGTAFLDGARWALDLAHERLCVEGGPFATPGGFGLVPERAGIGLRVQQVLPGSPADRAGIRAGEVIAQWAGLPASRPLAELWLALQGREELVLGIGEPVRALTLKRAIFAPAAP